jgi:hypothetical protein
MEYANTHKLEFMETSATENINIEPLFMRLCTCKIIKYEDYMDGDKRKIVMNHQLKKSSKKTLADISHITSFP